MVIGKEHNMVIKMLSFTTRQTFRLNKCYIQDSPTSVQTVIIVSIILSILVWVFNYPPSLTYHARQNYILGPPQIFYDIKLAMTSASGIPKG